MSTLAANNPSLYLNLSDAIGANIVASNITNSAHSNTATIPARQDLHAATLTTYTTARRLGLGRPLRVMLETAGKGSVALHSYLNAPVRHRHTRDTRASTPEYVDNGDEAHDIVANTRDGIHDVNDGVIKRAATKDQHYHNGTTSDYESTEETLGHATHEGSSYENEYESAESEDEQMSKLLVATVVTPDASHIKNARRVMASLERLGTLYQKEMAKEGQDSARATGPATEP